MRRTTRLTFFLATLACSWAAAQNLVTNQVLQLTNGTYGTPAKVPLETYAERNGAGRLDNPMLQSQMSVAVSVTPVSVSLSPGQKQQFTAVVTGTTNTAVTWSVKGTMASISPVGTVSNTGLYTGPASLPGSLSLKVTVTATSVQDPTKSAAASVTVTPAVTVTVSPGTVTLGVGQTQQFSAVVTGTTNTAVTWSVNPAVGTVSSGGLYSAPATLGSPQTVTVTATSVANTSKTATASVTIVPPIQVTVSPSTASLTPSQTQQFTATVTGTTNTAVTWSVSPAVGTISSGGLYTAPATLGSPQTVTVTATSVQDPTKSATASVTVTPAVTVTVSPGAVTLGVGQTQRFSAAVTGTTNTAVTWSVNPAVGSVSSGGLYTAPGTLGSPQTVTVTAASVQDPTKSATANVTVTPAVTVTVSPGTVTLGVGQTQQFTATVTGTTNTAVTWSVSPAVGSVSSGGLYTAPATLGSPQTVTVTATSVADTSKTATASVTIVPPIQVTVSPSTASLTPSQTQQFTATVTGTTNTAVTWSVSPAVGTISSGGLYTAPASLGSLHSVTVMAASVQDPTKSATASVTITSLATPPVTVTVSPGSATLGVGQTQQFSATVTGTTSAAATGLTNPAVTWSVSPAVGTISSGGLYTAPATLGSPQTVTVTATSVADPSKTATASVTITPPVTVSVTPTAATMLPSQAQTFTATVGGTTNTGVTWSIAPATGTISSSGLYTAPPTISSTRSVMVTATSVADATKSASATVTLIPPVQITTSSLPGGTVGTAYNATLAATGGVAPYTWSVASGQLPPGTSLSTSTGLISGTPTTAGSYNITMQVTDAAGYQATALLTLVIAACTGCSGPLSITTSSLPAGSVGVPYNSTLVATGGTAPYTWSTASGQLPTGLGLDPAAGTISGTPSTAGAYNFTAMVTDAASPQNTASQALAINVTAAPATDEYGGLMTLRSPGGMTGKWGVEKYPTADGHGRWLITTPEGHGFWCGAQYAVTVPSNLNVAAKYGSKLNWERAAIARYTGWGFNCMAEYSDYGMQNNMTAGTLGGAKVPYWRESHISGYAMKRSNFSVTGDAQVLPTDAVKNLNSLIQTSIPYSNYVPDGFDPNLSPYVSGYMDYALSYDSVTYGDGWSKSLTSPYMIGIWLDDNDYLYGFGPGPDDCASGDGAYHASISWIAMAAPTQAYVQWLNTGNVYDTGNWVFTDTNVYAKQNLISYLKTKYSNNISALNAAWGTSGHYTAFDSAATRYTGETVGVSDGVSSTITHTLAHASGISLGTLVLKVNGAVIGTDLPKSAGTILTRWPDGATTLNGTINKTTGLLTLTASVSMASTDHTGTGSTSWGTVSIGHTNVIPGSIVIRRLPTNTEDCRLADDGYNHGQLGTQQETCSPTYTVSGTIDYTAGTISNLTISPALSNTEGIHIQHNYYLPLPNACGVGGTSPCTVTVDYDVNGWGVGTTLADENGASSHTWLGDYILAKPGNPGRYTPTASIGAWTDLSTWLYNYTDALMTNSVDVIKTKLPNVLVTQGVSGHYGCGRKGMVQAVAAHTLMGITPVQAQLDLLPSWGLGDVPIIDSWQGIGAQLDSPGQSVGWDNMSFNNYGTQALRGAAMANLITSDITARAAGDPVYQITGIKFWAYNDTDGYSPTTNSNYGLVTPSDNAYDGHENVSGSVACSSPIQAYACGGETYTWASGSNGDAITPVKAALQGIWRTIGSAK